MKLKATIVEYRCVIKHLQRNLTLETQLVCVTVLIKFGNCKVQPQLLIEQEMFRVEQGTLVGLNYAREEFIHKWMLINHSTAILLIHSIAPSLDFHVIEFQGKY